MNKRVIFASATAAASIFFLAPNAKAAGPIYLSTLAISDTDDQSSIPATGESHHSSNEFLLGPEASVFLPTSSKTKNAYGSSWASYTLGIGSAYQANTHGSFAPYYDVLYNTHNNNRAFVLPVGVSYAKALSTGSVEPYISGQVVAIGVDQKDVADNVHSGFHYGEGARAAAGVEFSKYAYVEAGYLVSSTIKSFSFSGTELSVGIRF